MKSMELSAMEKKRKKGFTLVELMVVVAIIGILASYGVPKMLEFVYSAQTAEAVQTMGRISDSLIAYQAQQVNKTLAEVVTDLNTYNALSDNCGNKCLRTILPTVKMPPNPNYNYVISTGASTNDDSASSGAKADELIYCIKANRNLATGQTTVYYVLFSSHSSKAPGWEGNINRSNFVTKGDTPTAGAYCSADGTVSTTYVQ